MLPLDYIREPEEIYRRSFAEIEGLAELAGFPDSVRPVVTRIVHACGMPDICRDLHFSSDAAERGRAAIENGAPILCDVDSVRAGIVKRLLPAGVLPQCEITSPKTGAHALRHAMTRAAAQFDLWESRIGGAVVVIGNAPTALFRLMENIDRGGARPQLVLAFPVGFVGAAESKAELVRDPRGMAYMTLLGRRGGSAMAAAALNGIAGGLGT
jgi:precorrin-8X/cobalt-precorrin-8 methylmutase